MIDNELRYFKSSVFRRLLNSSQDIRDILNALRMQFHQYSIPNIIFDFIPKTNSFLTNVDEGPQLNENSRVLFYTMRTLIIFVLHRQLLSNKDRNIESKYSSVYQSCQCFLRLCLPV